VSSGVAENRHRERSGITRNKRTYNAATKYESFSILIPLNTSGRSMIQLNRIRQFTAYTIVTAIIN